MTLPSPQPKMTPYLTVIPTRRPVQKTHTSIGHAKNALNGKWNTWNGSECDMQMYEYAEDGWKLLYDIKKGDTEPPWRAGEREAAERKKIEAAVRKRDATIRQAKAEARHYYENVIGNPQGEGYSLFVEGYVEGYLKGHWSASKEYKRA